MPKKPAPLLELTSLVPRERIIQDDGDFMLVSTKGLEYAKSCGLLIRRAPFAAATPYGYECLGSYRQLQDTLWHACIDNGAAPQARSTGIYGSELDALVNLWASRRMPQLGPTV